MTLAVQIGLRKKDKLEAVQIGLKKKDKLESFYLENVAVIGVNDYTQNDIMATCIIVSLQTL